MTDDIDYMSTLDCGSVTVDRVDTLQDDCNGMENEIFDVIISSSRPAVFSSLNGSQLENLHQDLDCGSVTPESDNGYYGDL